MGTLPEASFLVGLSSVLWREAWKYGERAFRYCQHDVGHAVGTLRFAAAALGWRLFLLDRVGCVAQLLGLDRDADYAGAEREHPELLAAVVRGSWTSDRGLCLSNGGSIASRWYGTANVLSPAHGVEWPLIDHVAAATTPATTSVEEDFSGFPTQMVAEQPSASGGFSAERVILGRRSAVSMDASTSISSATFFRMLARLVPTRDRRSVPWDAIPWRPRIHLGLFVHRVDDLSPGLYALARDPAKVEALRQAMQPDFLWQRPPSCPHELPLYLLKAGDCRALAARVSCGQDIAGDGAFSLGMIADYMNSIVTYGASFYRSLFWEAGLVGQVLYLEAEEAGIRATGIGCYFDDPVHSTFGIRSRDWQSLYHFTLGGQVDDSRLTTLPAYKAEPNEHDDDDVKANAMKYIPLLIEFVDRTNIYREPDITPQLPIVQNGPPGTFVIFSDGTRVPVPTDQVVFADDTGGCARVGFGGMRFDGLEEGRLVFHRIRDLEPEHMLSPERGRKMTFETRMVSSISVDGRPTWPVDD